VPWYFTGTGIGRGHEREEGNVIGFRVGIKTGPSLPLLGSRVLDSNASELALHCMYSDTSEGDLKELQNRVRGDLASTIHDLRDLLDLESANSSAASTCSSVGWGIFASSQLSLDGTGYDTVVLKREEKTRHRVKQKGLKRNATTELKHFLPVVAFSILHQDW
jgi:hypothetical protein